ncbi:adenosine deaminase [Rhodococcus sp. BL-253-APC-6A1W]|uniref:adenosine deaminase n=1 Tax=unclassified Rhodococcus (in: high G+C Gram-positive bacteria) TaxID=192944 RepID=UPI003211E0D2
MTSRDDLGDVDRHASPEDALAELHVHIEGTLEPELMLELAERNHVTLPHGDVDYLLSGHEFSGLQSFLDLYYANMEVLRTAEDFSDLARGYLARAARAGITHAEFFFDPQAHVVRGVPLEDVVEGLSDAVAVSRREFGVDAAMIASIVRDHPVPDAHAMFGELMRLQAPIVALGLDSAEVGYPPSLFEDVFARARAEGLHITVHAGEEGPPEYVWQALDLLGAERIDHGIRSLEDPALVERLVEEQIPLTTCPLSNVRLHVVESLSVHPLHRMLDAGLAVTINSDDPAYFGGYVDDVFAALHDELGLTEEERKLLARNSIRAAFT